MIAFSRSRRPEVDAIRALYAAAPLRRPIHEPQRIAKMFESSNVVLSAWDDERDGRLVGLLRGWTDFAWDGYICDLAIHPAYQKQDIGRRLLELARATAPGIQWVLLASPIAKDYYAHLGWEAIPNGWELGREGWSYHSCTPEEFGAQHADLAARA